MIDQVRSEWIKFWSVRSTLVVLLIGVLLGVGFASLFAAIAKEQMDVSAALAGIHVSPLLFIIVGVQIVGQEYRFKTIRNTLAATPRREIVVGAKAVVLAGAVSVATLLLCSLSIAAAIVVNGLRGRGFEIDFKGGLGLTAGTVVSCVVSAGYGFAVTCIVRQPVAGIVAMLIWATAGEAAIAGLVDGADKWLPLSGTINLTTIEPDPSFLSAPVAGVYSVALCLLVGGLGLVRIVRSDA